MTPFDSVTIPAFSGADLLPRGGVLSTVHATEGGEDAVLWYRAKADLEPTYHVVVSREPRTFPVYLALHSSSGVGMGWGATVVGAILDAEVTANTELMVP